MSEATEKELLGKIVSLVEELREDQFNEFISMLREKFCLACGRRYKPGAKTSCSCENDE